MPPCGYRPPAISGIDAFLRDNLRYFVDLYRPRGLTPQQAIDIEMAEIGLIRSGGRGGVWSASVVETNKVFYEQLSRLDPQGWDDVLVLGRRLIADASRDLSSLTHDPGPVGTESPASAAAG